VSEQDFKTLRHMEAVRNFIGLCIKELLHRAEQHDQTKLESPEREIFEEHTAQLRGTTFGSDDYKRILSEMKPALDHHYAQNRHHPEHFKDGVKDMNLIDILEMLCDWKASSMRHNDGNLLKSIESQQGRFHYSDDLRQILENTAHWIDSQSIFHAAEQS
jgi:hypothetical protein